MSNSQTSNQCQLRLKSQNGRQTLGVENFAISLRPQKKEKKAMQILVFTSKTADKWGDCESFILERGQMQANEGYRHVQRIWHTIVR